MRFTFIAIGTLKTILTALMLVGFLFPCAAAAITVRAGLEQNPPLSYMDKQGKPAGFLVDLLNHVAAKEGWQVIYQPDTFDRCLEKLRNGDIDLMVTIAYSKERAELYDYNKVNIISNWGMLYSVPGSKIQSYFDLEGKKIAVMRKDSHHQSLRSMLKNFGIHANYLEVDNFDQVFASLQQQQADAGVVGRFYALSAEGSYNVVATPIIFNPIEVHYAVRKGANNNLLQAIDSDLAELKAKPDSFYYKKLDRWFGGLGRGGLPEWIKPVAIGSSLLLVLLSTFILLLRSKVKQRTHHLEQEIAERMRAENELKISEENYRSFAGLTSDYVHRCTRIGSAPFRLKWMGGSIGSISGYTPEEIFEKGCWLPFVHPDDREAVSAYLFSLLPGDMKSIDFRFIAKHGETRWISEKARCVAGEQEGELILLGAATDITEKREVVEKLRESEELFRLFMRHTPVYTYIKQIEGSTSRVIQLSDNFIDLVGRPAEELRGLTMEQIFSLDFARKLIDDDVAVVTEAKSIQLDEELNGRHYKTIKFPILREGKDSLIAGFTIDDTERKFAEQALSQYADIVQNMQVGMYVYHLENLEDDHSLRLVAANPKSVTLLGLSEHDIIGRTIDDIFPNLRQAGIPERFAEVVRTGQSVEVEEFFYSDQRVKAAAFAFKVFPLPDNHVGVLFEDITLRKNAEAALHNINRELEQRVNQRTAELNELNKELTAFNYSISHDMRAPLIRIKGYADILLDTCAPKLSEEEMHYISRLKISSNRLDEHIEALLKLYQITHYDVYKEPLNISDLAVTILNGLQDFDPDRKVTFTVADGIVVNVDKVLMKEFLDNLFSNAWKHTSRKEGATIELGVMKQDGRDVYFVSDNGVGFNMDQIDNIFTPFLRLHQEDSGLGIGLASVQRIIHLHGGKIWAESREGEGAAFYFTFN